jgi:leucyl-tRNA synthetase
MWTKALYDLGLITFDEPFKKLLNQGMIQGSSRIVYRVTFADKINESYWPLIEKPLFISQRFYSEHMNDKLSGEEIVEMVKDIYKVENLAWTTIAPLRIDVNIVDGVKLDINAFRNSKAEYKNAIFICEDGFVNTPLSIPDGEGPGVRCGIEIEKMSKSKYNTVNPDDLVEKYGADTFRMYEMFLGPVEMSKPWDTKGIEGVHRFLKKLWRLFYHENNFIVTDEQPSPEELKVLHKAIKKIEEDTERFSFNTCVSAFMVCVNELTDLKCHKKDILVPLIILLTPYAPHVSCEFWEMIKISPVGGDFEGAVLDASFPKLEKKYLEESSKEYPISVNGKLRTTINIDLGIEQKEVEEIVLQNGVIQKWLEGRPPKKIIFVRNKMVNVVV